MLFEKSADVPGLEPPKTSTQHKLGGGVDELQPVHWLAQFLYR